MNSLGFLNELTLNSFESRTKKLFKVFLHLVKKVIWFLKFWWIYINIFQTNEFTKEFIDINLIIFCDIQLGIRWLNKFLIMKLLITEYFLFLFISYWFIIKNVFLYARYLLIIENEFSERWLLNFWPNDPCVVS